LFPLVRLLNPQSTNVIDWLRILTTHTRLEQELSGVQLTYLVPSELVKEQFRCFPMFQGFKSNTEGLWKMASNIKNPLNGIVSLRSKNMQPPSTVLVRYMKEDLELLTIWPKP